MEQARSGQAATALAALPVALLLAPQHAAVLNRAAELCAACNAWSEEQHCRARAEAAGTHLAALERAVRAEQAGELDEAREGFDQAIAAKPADPAAWVGAVRLERKRGQNQAAQALLARALNLLPDNPDLLVEAAEIDLFHGRQADAAARLEAAFAAGLADPWMHRRYLQLLNGIGEYRKLIVHRATLTPIPGTADAFHADMLAGHARLALHYDEATLIAQAQQREASPRFLSHTAVRDRLAGAIAARQPFAVVRLGDGEGRFLAFLDPALNALMSAEERRCVGQSIWSNWFAADLSNTWNAQLINLGESLARSLTESDVIGLPLAGRLKIDHFHRGYLGYLDSYVGKLLTDHQSIATADAFINIALHQLSPFCADLLTGQDFVGVVSPHPGLAARLASHLAIPTHQDWLIPGETRLPDRPGLARGVGHFPERYITLMDELKLPYRGAVVLVAAGLLGKIYCARVKALGGIAIDIGSVVDAWMGFATRPGQYQPASAWQLPVACLTPPQP